LNVIPVYEYMVLKDISFKFSPPQEGGNGKLLFNRYLVSVWGDEEVLKMDGSDGASTLKMV
jgi:hypothetical protein